MSRSIQGWMIEKEKDELSSAPACSFIFCFFLLVAITVIQWTGRAFFLEGRMTENV